MNEWKNCCNEFNNECKEFFGFYYAIFLNGEQNVVNY